MSFDSINYHAYEIRLICTDLDVHQRFEKKAGSQGIYLSYLWKDFSLVLNFKWIFKKDNFLKIHLLLCNKWHDHILLISKIRSICAKKNAGKKGYTIYQHINRICHYWVDGTISDIFLFYLPNCLQYDYIFLKSKRNMNMSPLKKILGKGV